MIFTLARATTVTLPCAEIKTIQHLSIPPYFVRALRVFSISFSLGSSRCRPSLIGQILPARAHIPICRRREVLARRSTTGIKQSTHLISHKKEIRRPLHAGQQQRFFGPRECRGFRFRNHPCFSLAAQNIGFRSETFQGLIRALILRKFGRLLINMAQCIW